MVKEQVTPVDVATTAAVEAPPVSLATTSSNEEDKVPSAKESKEYVISIINNDNYTSFLLYSVALLTIIILISFVTICILYYKYRSMTHSNK